MSMKDNCKIRYLNCMHYFTLPIAELFFYSKLIPQQLSMKFEGSMHTYITLQVVTNVALFVNTQLSEL